MCGLFASTSTIDDWRFFEKRAFTEFSLLRSLRYAVPMLSPRLRLFGVLTALWFNFVGFASSPAIDNALHDAVSAGDLAKVKALVEKNPALVLEKNDSDETPLH